MDMLLRYVAHSGLCDQQTFYSTYEQLAKGVYHNVYIGACMKL